MPRIRYAEPIPERPVTYLKTVTPRLSYPSAPVNTLRSGTSAPVNTIRNRTGGSVNTIRSGTSGGVNTLSGGGGVDNISLMIMQRQQEEARRQEEIRRAREKAWGEANKVRYEGIRNERSKYLGSGVPSTGNAYLDARRGIGKAQEKPVAWNPRESVSNYVKNMQRGIQYRGGYQRANLRQLTGRDREDWKKTPMDWSDRHWSQFRKQNLSQLTARDWEGTNMDWTPKWLNALLRGGVMDRDSTSYREPAYSGWNNWGGYGGGGYGGWKDWDDWDSGGGSKYNPYAKYFSLLNWRI